TRSMTPQTCCVFPDIRPTIPCIDNIYISRLQMTTTANPPWAPGESAAPPTDRVRWGASDLAPPISSAYLSLVDQLVERSATRQTELPDAAAVCGGLNTVVCWIVLQQINLRVWQVEVNAEPVLAAIGRGVDTIVRRHKEHARRLRVYEHAV